MPRSLLLGTAGHIDHGKTSLIRALTGIDTDRLPEEKQRGITIDLGFAALQLDDVMLGIIDVPGHERFVKNMLAGAMGIDLALLVVAADEAVMPQTREHFEALSYLSLSAGVIAVTKCDLVEAEMLALVDDDVSELVAGSFLQDAAIVHVSAKTGEGLDELRNQLQVSAAHIPEQLEAGFFKLSIDRCFSVPGQGTVVTGSVVSGKVSVGDSLSLLPQDEDVTVRNIQSHGQSHDSVGEGQRAAINLSGVHYGSIQRGDTLASPGSIVPSKLLSVQVSASRFARRPLKSLTGIRFYSGATETPGRLRLLEEDSLAAGESQLAQIELQESVCTNWGEPFVVRGLAANEVLGGGQVVDPLAYRMSHKESSRIKLLRDLAEGDIPARVAALAQLVGSRNWSAGDLWQRAGVIEAEPSIEQLVDAGVMLQFDLKGNPRWLHRETVEQLEDRILQSLRLEHDQDSLSPMIPLGRLKQHFQTLEPAELLTHLAQRLASEGRLRIDGEYIALPEWQPLLSANQQATLVELIRACEASGLTPPAIGEHASQLDKTPDEVESLLKVAVGMGELLRLPDKDPRDPKAAQRARIYLHSKVAESLVERVTAEFSASDQWTVSQFAEVFGLSRKYAIPLCTHLDQTGITVRKGDFRSLAQPNPAKS